MGLQHIARAQALAQVGQRALACRLQRLGQGGERAVIDLRDDAGLQLRDLQGHDMARCGGRGVAARHLQGQHPHGADAFVASLWPGQCGVSKQIHAAGIQCFSMEGVGVRRRFLAVPGGSWQCLAATLGQMALQCSGGVLQVRQRACVRLCAPVQVFSGRSWSIAAALVRSGQQCPRQTVLNFRGVFARGS